MSSFDYEYWKRYWEEERLFKVHSLFSKIWKKEDQIRELTCPRCGKKGKLMLKTTISKKKYSYRKWYVYHERFPIPFKTSLRIQKWCYLNRNQLGNSLIQDKIRASGHVRAVREWLIYCIRIRIETFLLR